MKKLLVILLLSSIHYAAVIHVPNDYDTIQEGINASVNGDTVLIAQYTYYENLILAKEIVLASHAIYDDLGSDWQDNENINNTIISGDHNGSAMIIRYGNIEPTVLGFTFQDGTGTSMLVDDCGLITQKRSGGGILIYKAYPTINYNRFINNGFDEQAGEGDTGGSVADGGAISHYSSDDVEFDEDRNHSSGELTYVDFADFDAVRDFILESALDSDESNSTRTVPGTLNIQNNYFEGNRSGDGENFYSLGFEGSIDVSYSTFEDIDCETNSVNKFVLRSAEDVANYVQNDISGVCIESNSFYVSDDGDDNNDGTETNPLKTIGHALTLVRDAETPTTIYLNPGVYSPSTNGEKFPIVLPDNVELIGDESENTILDAEASANDQAATMIIKEVENVRVANLTLTGGYSEGHGCTGGGGLLLTANDMFNLDTEDGNGVLPSYPVIENVIIEGNHSHNGGGLAFFRVNGPVLNNVIIRDNTATAFGGGIFSYVSTITMTDVTITQNENFEAQGGGMMLAASQGTFDNMTITDNTGCCHGAGIWTNNSGGEGNHSDGWTMTNSTISGNEGSMFGGGILFAWSHPTLINCTISGNTSAWGGGGIMGLESGFTLKESMVSDNFSYGGGGGIYVWGPLYGIEGPVIEDCIVTGNETGSDGGGIMLEEDVDAIITRTSVVDNLAYQYAGGIMVQATPATINNVTVSGNTSAAGFGVSIWDNASADITNSIFWGNNSDQTWVYSDSYASVNYSLIEGGYSGGGTVDEGEGNIDSDPLFVDASNGDFTLQEGSPCIDAGTADVDGDGDEDITDYFGLAPDMGAFEFLQAVTGLQYYSDGSTVTLYWSIFPDAQYYIVERSTDSHFTTDVVSDFSVDAFYTDYALEWDTEYFYRVAAYIGYWTDYSNVISVTLEFVGTADGDGLPATYAVHQNYPNPFNPLTTLRYDLPEDAMVNITIYDMMGRVVKILVNDQQTAGYRSTQWNATNDAGSPLSAGMYLYTIRAGDFSQTRKMLLLK